MSRKYSSILVTGGAGFIGSHIVDRLLTDGFEVTVIDNLTTGRLENVANHQGRKDFHFIKGDIRKSNLVKDILQNVDAVFHESARVGMTCSVEDPVQTNEVNVTGTLNLLKACVDSDVKRFIYASSAAVYGKTEALPHHEGLIPRPISPYGALNWLLKTTLKSSMKLMALKPFVFATSTFMVQGRRIVPIVG